MAVNAGNVVGSIGGQGNNNTVSTGSVREPGRNNRAASPAIGSVTVAYKAREIQLSRYDVVDEELRAMFPEVCMNLICRVFFEM